MKTLETGGAETDPDDSQDEVPGYEIGDSFVTGIEVGTKTGDFLEKMNAGGGAYKLYAAKTGKEKADGEVVTGDIVEDSAGKQRYAVIYGDLNGDGEIALTDLLREQKYILEILKLDEAFKEAADATRDGVVNIADLLRIQKHLLGVTEIAQ
ncbi:MAG: dockerin type I repeat-containing protein [Christensenellaceae bacterium]|nr:dockerin type I repeat-containing protein [Christensenellaceae bacterium]